MSIRLPLSRLQGRRENRDALAGTIATEALPEANWQTAPNTEENETPPPPPPAAVSGRAPKAARLLSLDAFRGLTIFGMLLVNNISLGAQTPKTLLHAEWSGAVHLADYVFPWFLFIVGVAVPYSQASARRKHLNAWQYDLKALWRALTLVFLGCVIDSFIAKTPLFGLGVLQIIGLAYFAVVLIGGLFNLRGRLVLAALLLAGHWILLKTLPQPGVGAGVFTEDHNVIRWINETYLSAWHLKGLVSVIPTTAMVLIGTGVGDLLRRKKIEPLAKVGALSICGAGLIAAGIIGSSAALLDGWALPMNKPVWSAPYILFTAGWACIGLAAMYLMVDVLPGKWGARLTFPLLVFGSNAIVAYVAPVLTKVAILRNLPATLPNGQTADMEEGLREWFYIHAGRIHGGWAYTLAYIGVWWCVLWFLYKRRWFLRV